MISLNDIENFASNYAVYLRGLNYYNQKKVLDLQSMDSYGLNWNAKVQGIDNIYNISVGLNKDSDIVNYRCECNCIAFSKYSGGCKHIVATLIELQTLLEKNPKSDDSNPKEEIYSSDIYSDNMKSSSKYSDFDIPDMLENFFEPQKNQDSNRIIPKKNQAREVEILMDHYQILKERNYNTDYLELDYDIYLSDYQPYIEYKIGYQGRHKYVLRDTQSFITALRNESKMEFGKNLTCDFSKDRFHSNSKKILDFIIYSFYKERNLKYLLGASTFVNFLIDGKKYLLLPEDIRKFMEIFEDQKIKLNLKYGHNFQKRELFVKKELPKLDFYLLAQDDNFILKTAGQEIYDSKTLLDSGIYIQDNIAYLSTEEENKYLKPLFRLHQLKIEDFKIQKNNEDIFLNKVVPYLMKKQNVYLPKSVSYEEIKEDLETKIYIETQGNNLLIRVHYTYGDSIFSLDGTIFSKTKKIVKVDRSQEVIIRNFFSKYRLKYVDKTEKLESHYIMNIENEIYDFLFQDLTELQEISSVFLDKKVKSTRNNKKLNMNVQLEESLLSIDFQMENMTPLEMEELYHNYRLKKQFYRLKDGNFIDLNNETLKNQLGSIEKLIPEKGKFSSEIKIPQYKSFYVDLMGEEYFTDTYTKNNELDKYIKKIKNISIKKYDDSLLENVTLRDYQRFGIQWLESLTQIKLGGILADDMGLGKTLQVIALLTKTKLTEPALIVVPKTLLYNWDEEIKKFSSKLKVLLVDGSIPQREKLLKNIRDYDVIITSYSLYRSDMKTYSDLSFSFCFLDEAQHIKNPSINLTKAIKTVNAKYRFALTGTPIENNLTELWSIFDFIMPGYLGNQGYFTRNYSSPIMKLDDKYALESLNFHIKPFILRRLKKDVLLELPPKIETHQLCDLDVEQKKLYQAQLALAKKEIETDIENKELSKNQIKIFSLLTRLRQICCHPKLFIDNYKGGSGKFEALFELLDELISGNHKTLVFSQFTTMLKLISDELKNKGIEHYYLDGKIKPKERLRLVNDFNNKEVPIFLISLKAGGTGLNLVGSDTVIHVDPWWNPSVENQASDRAHRIGQKNSVQVIKLITKGTIEEKITKLQEKKQKLIESVLQNEGKLINTLSEEDIKNLFDI